MLPDHPSSRDRQRRHRVARQTIESGRAQIYPSLEYIVSDGRLETDAVRSWPRTALEFAAVRTEFQRAGRRVNTEWRCAARCDGIYIAIRSIHRSCEKNPTR